ncbi:MAG TPA: hypothetical protein PLY77_14990, partial [Plasticicumulans sp.]|nr:hypothetical protein [Plasticicumulans sp.]
MDIGTIRRGGGRVRNPPQGHDKSRAPGKFPTPGHTRTAQPASLLAILHFFELGIDDAVLGRLLRTGTG